MSELEWTMTVLTKEQVGLIFRGAFIERPDVFRLRDSHEALRAEVARLTEAIRVQAAAVKRIDAKERAEYVATTTLDSEREMNAILTAKVARLTAALAQANLNFADKDMTLGQALDRAINAESALAQAEQTAEDERRAKFDTITALAQAHATIERMAVDAEAHHVRLAQAEGANMIPEPPPELNGMEVAAWDSGYERGRREQWQPIATAPRDRTTVLGYTPHASVLVGDVYYEPDEEAWRRLPDDHVKPTHWMPLPAAPASAPKEPRT